METIKLEIVHACWEESFQDFKGFLLTKKWNSCSSALASGSYWRFSWDTEEFLESHRETPIKSFKIILRRHDEQEESNSLNLQKYVEVFHAAKYLNDLISE